MTKEKITKLKQPARWRLALRIPRRWRSYYRTLRQANNRRKSVYIAWRLVRVTSDV